MIKVKLVLFSFLVLLSTYALGQETKQSQFKFPNSRMGNFAKEWFKATNTNSKKELKKYDKNGEWDDHLTMLIGMSKNVRGYIPYSISYETKNYISIYTKENNGSWIKVNLSLSKRNNILAMGIKKSHKPVDYALKNNLTRKEIRKLIKGISYEISKNYVIKKERPIFSNKLVQLMESGKYDSITQGDLLADVLTKDLIQFTKDKHLQVIPPSRINEVISRFGINDRLSLNKSHKNNDNSSAELHTNKNDIQSNNILSEHSNSDLNDKKYINSKILKNNIGYINISRFSDDRKTNNATAKIFSELKNVNVVIIDLRYSGGGDGKATENLLSYFFDSSKNNLSKFYANKPLYVLTSKKTFSAAEAFVYNLKERKRALIIGETTGGGGYRVDAFKLPYKFYFVNSIYTSFNTEKGEGWQGKGIKPDHLTSSENALIKTLDMIKNHE